MILQRKQNEKEKVHKYLKSGGAVISEADYARDNFKLEFSL